MLKKLKQYFTLFLISLGFFCKAQDSLPKSIQNAGNASQKIQFLTPSILVSAGGLFATTPPFHQIEKSIQTSFTKNGTKYTQTDDYLQYSPAIAYYTLDIMGVKSKNNLKNKFLIHIVSEALATGMVTPMKRILHRERPDGSDFHSFPSGHTTTAFVGAELLHQEYGHISPWISIAGYSAAAATGYLRMQNNAHWLGDVIAGAGMGILSARLGYWVVSKIHRHRAQVTSHK